MPKRQKLIDLNAQASDSGTLTISPGDTFTFILQNIQQFQGSLGIIFIGDTQQRLGVFSSGYYLFSFPDSGSKFDLLLSPGQTMAMGETEPSTYLGEIQVIGTSGRMDSFGFTAEILPTDKIQVATAPLAEQHPYRFLGLLSAAPTTDLAQYQIYFDTIMAKFFVYDGTDWVEV